jgi:GTP cyclohydrolase II
LDGAETSIGEVKRALEKVKAKRGMVWYYRASGKGEPPVQAIEVFKLIVESKLPISLSTKPDFSDYVDEKGQSLPRK